MSDINSMTAGEYVLGTLDPEERRAFERRLVSDPLLRELVAEWERDLAPLINAVEPSDPSSEVWDRIETSLDHMQSGENVVAFRRPVVRRRVPIALAGAIAASIAGFVFLRMSVGTGPIPVNPAGQPTAPSIASKTEPAPKITIATPCPSDALKAVRTASGPREPQGVREPASGAVSAASGVREQSGGVAAGRVPAADPQRSKPEGSGAISIASAPRPEGSGNVSIASAAKPEGTGNVSIASAPRQEGSDNLSIATAPRPDPKAGPKLGSETGAKPEGAANVAQAPASAPQGAGETTIASANTNCK